MAMTIAAPASLADSPADDAPATQPATSEPINGVEQPQPAPPKPDQGDENRPTSAPSPKKEAAAEADPANQVDDEEKRFWAEISTIGKLTDCSENIEECERRINELKEEIKIEKEMLKGEQHRLQKLSIELRKITTGHPLPVDPNAEKEEAKPDQADGEQSADGEKSNEDAWRTMTTNELLSGLKGLGQKKLETLCDAAPTVGDLEDLRGEASRAHLSFKDKLPTGFGQKIADAIEDRLIEHVAKCAPSAEEQAAAERSNAQTTNEHDLWKTGDDGAPKSILDSNGEVALGLCKKCGLGEQQLVDQPECNPDGQSEAINFDAITIEVRERLQIERKDAKSPEDFKPADLDDLDDPLVDGWMAFYDSYPITEVADAETVECESDARNWLYGWLSAQMVHEWPQDADAEVEPANTNAAAEEYEDVDEDDIP